MFRQMIDLETFQPVDKIRVSVSGFFSYCNKTGFSSSLKLVVHSKFLLFYFTLLQVLYLSFFKIINNYYKESKVLFVPSVKKR